MSVTTYTSELPFRQSVAKLPSERTTQDLTIINAYLKHLEALSSLRESHIRNLCKTIRYEIHDAHHVLFSRGELNTCWYILLSGSVFIESTMYLPRASFGKRTTSNQYRINECVILEPSEMLVIDYPENESKLSSTQLNEDILPDHNNDATGDDDEERLNKTLHRKMSSRTRQRSVTGSHASEIPSSMIRSSYSRTSDTSSAYSGSDVMQSSTNGEDSLMNNPNETDDESEESSEHSFPIHDHIRESLMKDAQDRTDDDINAILEFLVHFPAFADLTLHVRRELCKVLVYAQVERAQTVVMNDGERYDSWSVIINGMVDDETLDGQFIRTLGVGQSFGCGPTLDQYCHRGIMKTRVDDCQFVVVAQNDYYAILNQGEKNIRKIEENGKVVMIKEIRVDDDEPRQTREIVLKATVEKLLDLLVDDRQNLDDPTFVQDFLLTYRTFVDDPTRITTKLVNAFNQTNDFTLSEHIARILLSWVNNHYTDFESDGRLTEFLETFDDLLQNHETDYMKSWRHLLNLACFTKASIRTITITRSTRDDVLHFNILGGTDTSTSHGIFVSKVERNSKAYESGLRRGDQILNVNGQCFNYVTHVRALEILRAATHLSLTVKNNLMGLNEMVHPEKSPARKKRHDLSSYEQEIRTKLNLSSPIRSPSSTPTSSPLSIHSPSENSITSTTTNDSRTALPNGHHLTPTKQQPEKNKPRPLTKRMGLKRAVMQKFKISKTNSELDTAGLDHVAFDSHLSPVPAADFQNKSFNRSSSNPDLASVSTGNTSTHDEEESAFVVKVYRSDQSFKYFPIHKDTTAQQLVMLAMSEFGITEHSRCYSLCEVSVENGVLKQKRLSDQINNLPERLPINARYYLKNNQSTETLVPDHLANEFIREAKMNFLQLDALEICAQLTLRDFATFKSIQPTEYVDHIFKLNSNYGIPHLDKFLKLPNQEMYWTISEILRETNVIQRAKVIKHFIKIAKFCKEMKNFNSMFAIVSGLDHKTVQRLQATWDRVSEKQKRIFEELKSILDLSRNMSVYRNLLKNDFIHPPIIPMFPVCMKDLTFIHLGNQTEDEGLINFEKLRMIGKEIRQIISMASSSYDISNMFDSPTSSSHIVASFAHHSANDSSGTIRRHPTSMRLSVTANAKRIYDEALMVKKVKTYLNNAEIIEDEDRLLDMTNQYEPVTTLKRRPSPSTSSLSSNSSNDRRQGVPMTTVKFGTQSPDAVNKLLRLSDSSHQIKTRPMTKSQGIFRGVPALTNNGGTSTGLSALGESIHRHQTYKRDTQKLSCESSSVNLKFESSTLYIRSHLRPNSSTLTNDENATSPNTMKKSNGLSPKPLVRTGAHDDHSAARPTLIRTRMQRSKSQNELLTDEIDESKNQNVDYEDDDQVTSV